MTTTTNTTPTSFTTKMDYILVEGIYNKWVTWLIVSFFQSIWSYGECTLNIQIRIQACNTHTHIHTHIDTYTHIQLNILRKY